MPDENREDVNQERHIDKQEFATGSFEGIDKMRPQNSDTSDTSNQSGDTEQDKDGSSD